jgi:hypothetical protein
MCRALPRAAIIISFICAVLTCPVGSRAQTIDLIPDDPVAFIGHGMLFGRDGKIIRPDVDFIEKAQELYIKSLSDRLSEADRKTFDNQRSTLFSNNAIDRRNRLLANSKIIEALLKRVGDMPDGSISGKNALLRQLAEYEAPALRDKKFTPMPDLENRIRAAGFSNIALFSTTNFGAAYIAECQANGVPIPPDVGSNQWTLSTFNGNDKFPQLPSGSTANPPGNNGELFLPTGAQVYVYKSNAPEGMCVALPRSSNPGGGSSNTIILDGVICLGKTTSKVCFWDNQVPDGPGNPGPPFQFAEGTVTPISQFAGGADLLGGSGGVCTGCHAGENPYIMHPGTPLSRDAFPSFPTMADNWYDPLVHPNWPQNAGPINQALVPAACSGCHNAGNAGRFPLLTSRLLGSYCSVVLGPAINRTMPPGAPGSLSGNSAVQAFLDLCNRSPRPLVRIEKHDSEFWRCRDRVYLQQGRGHPQ